MENENVVQATMFIGEIKRDRERERKSRGQNFCLGTEEC